MKYYIVVGEASGDLHTAKLMRGIMKADSQAEFRFWGGDKMAEVAGYDAMVCHYKDAAVMGFVEVLKNIRKIAKRLKLCKHDISEYRPDVVILVDFAGFNLKIAKYAKQNGFKTFFYIAPKVWAWKERRVKAVKKWVDELFVIFPFEVEYFKRFGIDAHYEGNPIMDEIESHKNNIASREVFLADNNLKNMPYIALLAGSRKKEIESNLPFMNDVAESMPNYNFVVAGVPWLDRSIYDQVIKNRAKNLQLVIDKTYETLSHSEAAIVTSGTATLETALLKVPEVVCYKVSAMFYDIMKHVLKIKYISLVNIVLDKTAVVELISTKYMTINNATKELTAILPNGNRRDDIMADYQTLENKMGLAGASDRFGRLMVELLKK